MDPQQQYCLKWNSYSSNLAMAFSNLFKSETLTDVTLLCGGTIFKAHKLILAACSKNFADLFEAAPTNGGSIYVILEATSAANMSALLEFMYKGEVHVSQESLSSFLKAAESLQVKGLSVEHGHLAAAQSQTPQDTQNLEAAGRRSRNNLIGTEHPVLSMKQECDSLMQPANTGIGGFPPYMNHLYQRPHPFDPPRKRHLRSPFPTEQETRDSVLRDGSKASTGSVSPISKGYRPGSSASTTAPSEADSLKMERVSPQQSSSRYENNSPPSAIGNGILERTDDKDERGSTNTGGAEDLRIKMETDFSPPARPSSNSKVVLSPAQPLGYEPDNSTERLTSIATAQEMLNIWPASKLAGKGGSVNTADGKKLRCPLCDRLYGYETNLRAHIRQRHQGIRVPCPYCSRTFTRNNTVRRHIAREHKTELDQKFEHPPMINQTQGRAQ